MPVQANSADKARAAQEARRRAARRSAAGRQRSGTKPPAPVAAAQADPVVTTAPATEASEDRLADLCEMVESNPSALGADTDSVRQLCRSRRQALSAKGKTAVGGSSPSRRPTRPPRTAVAPMPVTPDEQAPVTDTVSPEAVAELDVVCELAEVNPGALGADVNSVRQLCRNRRQALSSKGKAAVAGKRRTSGRASIDAGFLNGNASTRDLARKRRQELSSKGRGNAKPARPSGRVRPHQAPPKVETGTTLSGSEVTGTQVERKASVTGNESGTCRVVTGTEYVGSEQFQTFCGTQPEANQPKVGFSVTSGGMGVSGTEVGRSAKVTGDEQGSCNTVTGTEYMGAERFAEFCENKGLNQRPAKVMQSKTEHKQMTVTGSDDARPNFTTGTEAGARQTITGSQYSDAGAAKMTINGPPKVALTHTIAGRPVTGTEVGRSAKVTGDEHGSCRPVTGTEYLSNEQFTSVCQAEPMPSPVKVGVDRTRRDQVVTGNLVDRTEKVTGNEPGSCQRVTGSQYGEGKLCGGAAPKVHAMQTMAGANLTGNRVANSPKVSGGGQGGCQPVTGMQYFGQQEAAYCENTLPVQPAKVGVEHTPGGQHVSGTMVNHVDNVTGNEAGSDLAISGTPYAGMNAPVNHEADHGANQGACCDSCAARQMAEAAGLLAPQAGLQQQQLMEQQVMQQQQMAEQAMQQQQLMEQQAMQQQQMTAVPVANVIAQPQQYAVQAAMPQPEPAAPRDFSIVSPARAAQITGNAASGRGITGPVNLGEQLVSGTPENRHSSIMQPQFVQQPQAPAPLQQVPATAPTPQQVSIQQPVTEQLAPETVPAPGQRITGEGRDGGISITGDNWARGHQITGTEGRSAQGRNPTLRCEARGAAFNAHTNRTLERPEAAVSAVTGSSGNTHQGAVITVSGGARG